MSEDEKPEIRSPSRSVLADWVVDWVIAANPADSTTIPRQDVEQLTGLAWESTDLKFVLIEAKKKLYHSTHFEWKLTSEGLYMLSDSERKDELGRRQRSALNLHRETLASAATIRRDKLTEQEKKEVEHSQRVSLYLYEQSKRAMRLGRKEDDDLLALPDGDEKKK